MNLADRGKTIDRIAEKIVELHQKYNRNTLVHCHSYHIADRLGQAVCDLGIRCKWVEKNEREENIQTWKEMNDVCLMSVACEEGLDLPGEKYPLNIIAKVPFGYRGDEWFMKRIEADASLPAEQKWENVAVAVAIQQAAGRCTRGPDDFSETYILDGSFEWFYKRNYALFEGWFKDALRRKTREA
jgi:Rad3-related DNA helicase